MHPDWLFISPPKFPAAIYKHYTRALMEGGRTAVHAPAATASSSSTPLSASPTVLFSDLSDDAYSLGFQYREQLYGIVYPTGVLVSGPLGPEQAPHVVPRGAPMQGFEALVLLTEDEQLRPASWQEPASMLWGAVDEAVRYAYHGGPEPRAREIRAASFPDLKGNWVLVYVLPVEDPESLSVMIASVVAFEFSKVAILGPLPEPDMYQLDNRYTVFVAPPKELE